MSLAEFKKLLKAVLIPTVLGVMLVGGFCLGSHTVAGVHFFNNDTPTTISQSSEHCCGTGIVEQYVSQKETFLLTTRETKDSWLFLTFGLLALAATWRLFRDRSNDDRVFLASKLYIKQKLDVSPFNHLKFSFAKGILNPKIY